ncbi:MAG TPA: MgtC/SapB family protein [Pseudolabrys sp.]|nr:MgtC/SapB family protein [Pseudolabrys sp.]
MSAVEIDEILRLCIATLVGIAIGFNRELRGKPLGMRTLALVALGAAIASTTAIHFGSLSEYPDALSRVVQGVIQGVLTGIGFIGAGVVLHDRQTATVRGLTTAATVWIAAALGISCALADWVVVTTGVVLTLLVLFGLGWVESTLMSAHRDDQGDRS